MSLREVLPVGLVPMETVSETQPITVPSDIKPGGIFMLNDIPYLITKVEPISDPWTHQAAIKIRLAQSETRIVFLVLSCRDCETQLAVRYNLAEEIDDWLQIKAGKSITWLCPSCRGNHGL